MKRLLRTLAIIFVALIAIDGLLTYWAVNYAGAVEQNPIMAPSVHLWLFPIYKVVTALLGVVFVLWLVKRWNRSTIVKVVATIGFVAGIAFYGLVLISNVMELI